MNKINLVLELLTEKVFKKKLCINKTVTVKIDPKKNKKDSYTQTNWAIKTDYVFEKKEKEKERNEINMILRPKILLKNLIKP